MKNLLLPKHLLFVCFAFVAMNVKTQTKLNPQLQTYCNTLEVEFTKIDSARKVDLLDIAHYVATENDTGHCNILAVCTSNSRRSQFTQVWLKTAATYYGFDNVNTFSGGTEATKCNERTVKALQRVGFIIEAVPANTKTGNEPSSTSENPVYHVTYSKKKTAITLFSKKYNNTYNPQTDFCAIMVCSEADKSCPHVDGASYRVGLPYEDPKKADGTPEEETRYDERCRQIAREMFFVMYNAKKNWPPAKKANNTRNEKVHR